MRKNMKTALFVLPLLTLSSSAYAMELYEALEKAVASNPTIQQSKHETESVYQGVKQARAGFLPTLTLNASASKYEQEPDTSADVKYHRKKGSLDLQQTLFAGGAVVSSYRSAKNLHVAAKASENVVMQDTLVSTASAYMNVLRDREIVALQNNQVNVFLTELKATNSRFKQGEVTKTDVKQAEAKLADAQAQLVRAKGAVVTSEATLTNLIGEMPEDLKWPKLENTTSIELPENIMDVKELVLSNHPSILNALSNVTSKKHLVTNSRSSYFPSIVATASYFKNDDLSGMDYDDQSIGVALSLPLFAGGKNISSVRKAKMDYAAAKDFYEQTRRNVEQELVDAFRNFQTARASLISFENAKEAAKLAAEGTRREAELGTRDVLDVLSTQQDYLNASVNVTTAKRDVVAGAFRLFAAMGQLSLENLKSSS